METAVGAGTGAGANTETGEKVIAENENTFWLAAGTKAEATVLQSLNQSIQLAISNIISLTQTDGAIVGSSIYTLTVTFKTPNNTSYTVYFNVQVTPYYDSEVSYPKSRVKGIVVSFNNPCIYLELTTLTKSVNIRDVKTWNSKVWSSDDWSFDVKSSIMANQNTENPCFTPQLVSNSRNADLSTRTTSTDVLQVIKTKLSMINPAIIPSQLIIQDAATIKNVAITPFRLLRGIGEPIYQKYGYFNPHIPGFKDWLKNKTVGQVRALLEKDSNLELIFQDLFPATDDAANFMEKMKEKLPFEEESRLNLEKEISFSIEICYAVLGEEYSSSRLDLYTLNPNSKEWKTWRQRIVITSATMEKVKNTIYGGSYQKHKQAGRTRKAKHRKFDSFRAPKATRRAIYPRNGNRRTPCRRKTPCRHIRRPARHL